MYYSEHADTFAQLTLVVATVIAEEEAERAVDEAHVISDLTYWEDLQRLVLDWLYKPTPRSSFQLRKHEDFGLLRESTIVIGDAQLVTLWPQTIVSDMRLICGTLLKSGGELEAVRLTSHLAVMFGRVLAELETERTHDDRWVAMTVPPDLLEDSAVSLSDCILHELNKRADRALMGSPEKLMKDYLDERIDPIRAIALPESA
jgi:hypothetical protein